VARGKLAPGLRALAHRDYLIYYQPTESEIIILRVLHGARDARAIFGR
jgi:toxin ParE1/3/4